MVGDMVGSFRHGVTSLAGGDSVGWAETPNQQKCKPKMNGKL